MKARCVVYTGDRATVVLEPGWLARMFGARARSVDLMRHPGKAEWFTVATGRDIDKIDHGREIRDALDFREVGSPSRWQLGCGTEAVGL